MKVGLIGCGNIGKELASYIDSSDFFDLTYIHDISKENINSLIENLSNKPKITDMDVLIEGSDLIIEAASKEAVKELFNYNLDGKKVLIMTTGALLDLDIPDAEIIVPTGAISGIDSLKAVSSMIEKLELITTKPPKSLELDIDEKKIIFEGNVQEAVQEFPKNINVAATIKLATGKDPKIKIIADPEAKLNKHEIIAEGSFGKLHLITENVPSKNPKTSYLAILSAIQCLKNLENNIKIGS